MYRVDDQSYHHYLDQHESFVRFCSACLVRNQQWRFTRKDTNRSENFTFASNVSISIEINTELLFCIFLTSNKSIVIQIESCLFFKGIGNETCKSMPNRNSMSFALCTMRNVFLSCYLLMIVVYSAQ